MLGQLEIFSANISSEQHDMRDQFRLLVAKLVFTDPRTGLLDAHASDVNLNPVLQLTDAVARKATEAG